MLKKKIFTKVGVIGFGGYIPKGRVRVEVLAEANGKNGKAVTTGLGVISKAVAKRDEDAISLAVEAGKRALSRADIKAEKIGSVLVGSESHPYAVKPSSTVVADVLGIGREYIAGDLEFACKAGTTGLIMTAGLIEAGVIEAGLVIGADVAQSKRGDVLEYTAGAGSGAILLGNNQYRWWAGLTAVSSINSDTVDFWRREGEKYPRHAGRFTGEPAYFRHVVEGTKLFLQKIKKNIKDFDQVIFHAPNLKFPQRAAQRLEVTAKQMGELLVKKIGNPYSASAMLQLIKVLEEAKKGEDILMTSYGSGAGADSFWWRVNRKLERKYKNKRASISSQINEVDYLSYSEYLQRREE